MAQQTAVEQLVNYMKENFHLTDEALEKFEQAKEMEKQQIIDAANLKKEDRWFDAKQYNNCGEKYFAETYGSKGSDDKKEPKDIVLGYKTSLEAQMLDSQLPQTEISDEEIGKKASESAVNHT